MELHCTTYSNNTSATSSRHVVPKRIDEENTVEFVLSFITVLIFYTAVCQHVTARVNEALKQPGLKAAVHTQTYRRYCSQSSLKEGEYTNKISLNEIGEDLTFT